MDRGTTFAGEYVIERPLGSGGFSRVYLATEAKLNRPVALKVLLPAEEVRVESYEKLKQRFFREAKYLSKLKEPQTVQLYDYGETDDRQLYMALEHVEGQDLSELIRAGGRLPPPTALEIIRQVLVGLREVHALGMLHRDIKPDNVIVFERFGELKIKLIDFGIAKSLVSTDQALTQTGKFIGTPRYLAPEQLTARVLSPATDIYATGLLLYHLLMGKPPFSEANSMEILSGDVSLDMRPRIANAAHIDPPVASFLRRFLAIDPKERFQNAGIALTELERSVDELVGIEADSDSTEPEPDRAKTVPGGLSMDFMPREQLEAIRRQRAARMAQHQSSSDSTEQDDTQTTRFDTGPPEDALDSDARSSQSEPAEPPDDQGSESIESDAPKPGDDSGVDLSELAAKRNPPRSRLRRLGAALFRVVGTVMVVVLLVAAVLYVVEYSDGDPDPVTDFQRLTHTGAFAPEVIEAAEFSATITETALNDARSEANNTAPGSTTARDEATSAVTTATERARSTDPLVHSTPRILTAVEQAQASIAVDAATDELAAAIDDAHEADDTD